MLAYFQKISIIFQILVENSDISLKTPQVQEAAIYTYENQWIKVGGVLKTFWIDLMIPINFIICNFYLYLDKFGQSWVKFQFFLILQILNANSFPGNNLILFCKTWIFPIIFDTFPLWEKYKILKNHCRNVHENCLHVPLIFSRFGHPLSPISEMP